MTCKLLTRVPRHSPHHPSAPNCPHLPQLLWVPGQVKAGAQTSPRCGGLSHRAPGKNRKESGSEKAPGGSCHMTLGSQKSPSSRLAGGWAVTLLAALLSPAVWPGEWQGSDKDTPRARQEAAAVSAKGCEGPVPPSAPQLPQPLSRELFYKTLLWGVTAACFRENSLCPTLPGPASPHTAPRKRAECSHDPGTAHSHREG